MSEDDDVLLFSLRTIASGRAEAAPPMSRAAARAAFTWRRVDDELALLGYDSALEATTGVRGGDRLLTFAAPGVTIDLEVVDVGGSRALVGQATGSVRTLEVQRPSTDGEDLSLTVDEHGGFRAEGVDPGVLRLRCLLDENAGGPRIVSTEWVAI